LKLRQVSCYENDAFGTYKYAPARGRIAEGYVFGRRIIQDCQCLGEFRNIRAWFSLAAGNCD
jgi:hypothetical protein